MVHSESGPKHKINFESISEFSVNFEFYVNGRWTHFEGQFYEEECKKKLLRPKSKMPFLQVFSVALDNG